MKKTYEFCKSSIAVLLIAALAAGSCMLTGCSSVQKEPEEIPATEIVTEATEETIEETTEATTEETTEATTEPTEPTVPPLTENPNRVPDFTVYDLDGNAHNLYDFRGKPIILNFWASWCGPCKSEMPDFEEAYQKYGEDAHFLMVNVWDTVEEGSAFIADSGYTFPIYYDTTEEVANAFKLEGIPTTYFLDADAVPVNMQLGMLDPATLDMNLQMLGLAEMEKVPDFTVYDLDGNAHNLYDFQGKPVVLNFWASWCGPCKQEMPDFEKAYQQYGEDIQFLMVDVWDTKEEGSAFIAKMGYTFPIFYDTNNEAANGYNLQGIPTTYFLDAEGYPVYMQMGMLDAKKLEEKLQLLLNEE